MRNKNKHRRLKPSLSFPCRETTSHPASAALSPTPMATTPPPPAGTIMIGFTLGFVLRILKFHYKMELLWFSNISWFSLITNLSQVPPGWRPWRFPHFSWADPQLLHQHVLCRLISLDSGIVHSLAMSCSLWCFTGVGNLFHLYAKPNVSNGELTLTLSWKSIYAYLLCIITIALLLSTLCHGDVGHEHNKYGLFICFS